jgi:hypothetical protein
MNRAFATRAEVDATLEIHVGLGRTVELFQPSQNDSFHG